MSSSQQPSKLTPVHEVVRELGAHFIEIAGWQVAQVISTVQEEVTFASQHVALADGSASGKIMVEGKAAESLIKETWAMPPLTAGQGAIVESNSVFRLRDDQFFIRAEPVTEGELLEVLTAAAGREDLQAVVIDFTHGLADLRVVGPRSAELLRRLCGLDFHPNQFPELSAKQSSVAKTRQLILRHDLHSQDKSTLPAFSLIGARSLAPYLWQTILEAGHDLDLKPIGWSALERLPAGK